MSVQDSSGDKVFEVGTIKFFDPEKGFGFVEQASGRDILVHAKSGRQMEFGEGNKARFTDARFSRPPQRGERIVFVRQDGQKGPKANPWALLADLDGRPAENVPRT